MKKTNLLLTLGMLSCGTDKEITRTETCEPVIVTEYETVENRIETVIEKDTPLFFMGHFCGKTILEHDNVYYLVHSGLRPLYEGTKVKVSNHCKIRLKEGQLKEIKS